MITFSTAFQILGSICVFVGYWLNSKNHARQHQLFILGHVFLIAFSLVEQKWVIVALSVFVIYMQYKISRRKYKFKKDIVRIKKVARKAKPEEISICIKNIKSKRNENKRMPQERLEVSRDRHKESHVLQSGQGQVV